MIPLCSVIYVELVKKNLVLMSIVAMRKYWAQGSGGNREI